MSEKQPEKKVGFFARAKKSSKASLNELKQELAANRDLAFERLSAGL